MSNTRILPITDPDAIPIAMTVLKADGLIVFPTETLYGLAGRINETSLHKIYAAKQRPEEKAIPVLVANLVQLNLLTPPPRPAVLALVRAFWPGPLTLVLPKLAGLPPSLTPYPGLAIRMPNHAFALQLLQKTGPLAVTSANISGNPTAATAEEVHAQLGDRAALILDGGIHPGGQASTVINCQGDVPLLLREGPIPLEAVEKTWQAA